MSPHRRRRPDLDEKFGLPDDTDPDDVLRRLLGVPVDEDLDPEEQTEGDSSR